MTQKVGTVLPLIVLLSVACIAVLFGMSTGNILVPVSFAYAVAFSLLVWNRIEIALGIVLVLAPWVQDVSGGGGVAKFSAAELHIFLIAVVLVVRALLERNLITIGQLTGPVVLYMALMGVSSYQGGIEREDIIALFQTGIFCFVLPYLYMDRRLSPQSQRNIVLAAACSTVLLGIFQIVAGPKAFALGIHKNNVGQGMAAGLAIWMCSWFDRITGWWSKLVLPALAIVTVALVFTLSRGAWVGAGCAFMALAIMYGRLQLILRAVLVIVPLVGLMWTYLPKEDQQYATSFDRKKYDNIDARYNNFERTSTLIAKSPIIGNGISIRKQLDATNLVMVTLAEGGVLGFVLFLVPLGVYFKLVATLLRKVPQSDPRFFVVSVSCAVMISRLSHAQFDHYWVRGASTIAWASVGMVLAISRSLTARRSNVTSALSDRCNNERVIV